MSFNESIVEDAALEWCGELGYAVGHELKEAGSWVLLQPERIHACVQVVIPALQVDEHQRGCLMEERVLKGDLAHESSMPQRAGRNV